MFRNKSWAVKLSIVGAAAAALLVGMLAVGCVTDEDAPGGLESVFAKSGSGTNPGTDPDTGKGTGPVDSVPAYVGYWVDTSADNLSGVIFNENKTYEFFDDNVTNEIGAFTVKGDTLTITPNKILGTRLVDILPNIDPDTLYTKIQLKQEADSTMMSDEEFESDIGRYFKPVIWTYKVTGDILSLKDSDGITTNLNKLRL